MSLLLVSSLIVITFGFFMPVYGFICLVLLGHKNTKAMSARWSNWFKGFFRGMIQVYFLCFAYLFIPTFIWIVCKERIWFLTHEPLEELGEIAWFLRYNSMIGTLNIALSFYFLSLTRSKSKAEKAPWIMEAFSYSKLYDSIGQYYICLFTYALIWSGGSAPTNWSTCAPPLKIVTKGILLTL